MSSALLPDTALSDCLTPGARAATSPGVKESAGPLADEEPADFQEEEGKVFNLDGPWGGPWASWSPEEEEERYEDGAPGGGDPLCRQGAAGSLGASSRQGRGGGEVITCAEEFLIIRISIQSDIDNK